MFHFCCAVYTPRHTHTHARTHHTGTHALRKLWIELLVKSRVHVIVMCFVAIKQRGCRRLFVVAQILTFHVKMIDRMTNLTNFDCQKNNKSLELKRLVLLFYVRQEFLSGVRQNQPHNQN